MPDMTSQAEHSGTVLTDAFLLMVTARPGSRAFNVAHLPAATETPSGLVKASPLLMGCLMLGMDGREMERRARGAQRLKEAFSSILWHTQRAAKDPDYWHGLYASRINW